MKKYLELIPYFLALGFVIAFCVDDAHSQSVPFNAYSVQTLGGNCTQQGSIMYQSANGQSVCLGAGGNGQVLKSNGPGANIGWATVTGVGTVTSVGLSAPAQFSVANSPITAAGTLALSWQNQTAKTILAGPSSGAAAAPTFRALVGDDLPNPSSTKKGGVISSSAPTNQFANGVNTSGVITYAQPAFSNLSGNIATSQMNGGSGATSGTFWRGDGSWNAVAFSNLSGNIATSQMNGGSGAAAGTFWRGDGSWSALWVTSTTAMKALTPVANQVVYLNDNLRAGNFAWNGSDLSANLLGPNVVSSAVDSSTETITSANHQYRTGNGIVVTSNVNGLNNNTVYFAIRVDDNNYRIATSYANAMAGTPFNLTGTSTTTTRVHLDPMEGVYVCASTSVSCVNGGFVRQFGNGPINAQWFGAGGGTALTDRGGIQAAIDYFGRGFWNGTGITYDYARVYIPAGIYLVDPAFPIEPCDYLQIFGDGWGSTMLKASTTSSGAIIRRAYNGTATGNPRVNDVKIYHMRAIITGQNQYGFDLRHIGRVEAGWIIASTQDRNNEYNNANQAYWPGSVGIAIGVGDSVPNGYINGTDLAEIHDFKTPFMEYGVMGAAAGANQKSPESIKIYNGEISDTRQPIVFNPSAAMIGHIYNMTIQRWGSDTINASTGTAPAQNYAIDSTANKYYYESIYFEDITNTLAAILIRTGSNNCIVDASTMNRYGTGSIAIYTDEGVGTVIR